MIDKVQAQILESLNNYQNFEGKTIADKFDELSLSDFSKGIYSNLPLYTDEIVGIILNFVRSIFDKEGEEVKQFLFINSQVLRCINNLILKQDNTKENLIALSIWTNVLNVYVNDVELYTQNEDYKNYLMSYLSPDINSIKEEIEDNNIQAITIPAGSYFIRMKDNNLIPTKETKEKYNNYLNY